MKKLLRIALLLVANTFSTFTSAAPAQSVEAVDPGFVILDVLVYRPLGAVATLVGGAVFIGMSPLTAFASIPAPHDAFDKTFKILVAAPAAYTLLRPLGDRRVVGYGSKYTPQSTAYGKKTYQPSVRPSQQPALSPVQEAPVWLPKRNPTYSNSP